ncbi:MAG TPA: radical SAM protein [Fimbriimonas sp.]|nr:radical SAM protein [Fimbriimonas sp.]
MLRLAAGVRLRREIFGGVVYVAQTDSFFALDTRCFDALESVALGNMTGKSGNAEFLTPLVNLGILDDGSHQQFPATYSLPRFVGRFQEVPAVSRPLVVNCFATAYCPLRCLYCHADDLMASYRPLEDMKQIDNVIATAGLVDAMVAVVTGGDPLTRPERTKRLIPALSKSKALVLDTAGVDPIEPLLDMLVEHNVHVRISLDAISVTNDVVRPGNRNLGYATQISRLSVERTIDVCLRHGIAVTVQTVVSRFNDSQQEWEQMRTWLIDRGVRQWVFHMLVKGGKARRAQDEKLLKKQKRGGVFPTYEVRDKLWRFISDTIQRRDPIAIRCTDTDVSPTSVLLVGSAGNLFTEGRAHNGKVPIYEVGEEEEMLNKRLSYMVDWQGHSQRYLNWNSWQFDRRSLSDLCIEL